MAAQQYPSSAQAADSRPRAYSTSSLSSGDSEDEHLLEPDDGVEWQDAEPQEEEALPIKDLFSNDTFQDAKPMLEHCKRTHGLDLLDLIQQFKLDILDTIKLINYCRKAAATSTTIPQITSKDLFSDDEYLKPVLQDDGLLCCLDDLLDPSAFEDHESIEDKLARITAEYERLQLVQLETQELLSRKLDLSEATADSGEFRPRPNGTSKGPLNLTNQGQNDKNYFDSYDRSSIHREMVQDAARTDAYRDFIYDNKHLFKDKVVLDIGCGTGILSMFCAKAGAARVFAVDNSSIAEKARTIVSANRLDDIISVHRCKVEDLVLPDDLTHVDIIVSEWMGYCLLYEAMLDSVIYARDKFLRPDTGLMVPSHATMHLAAIEDATYIDGRYTFWHDVYGFDMSAMMQDNTDPEIDLPLQQPGPETIIARQRDERPFVVLDLHTVSVRDLEFKRPLGMVMTRDSDGLDAFVIWFDTIFAPSRHAVLGDGVLCESKTPTRGPDGQTIVLSTGPYAKATHWHCGVCVVDRAVKTGGGGGGAGAGAAIANGTTDAARQGLKSGQRLEGSISILKDKLENHRALEVKIKWAVDGDQGAVRRQTWFLR